MQVPCLRGWRFGWAERLSLGRSGVLWLAKSCAACGDEHVLSVIVVEDNKTHATNTLRWYQRWKHEVVRRRLDETVHVVLNER